MSINDEYDYFAKADLSAYQGEWVAICNRKVISHSKNLNETIEKAREVCGSQLPLYTMIPTPASLLL